MADESVSQNFAKNPDPQEKPVSGDDINPSQEQQASSVRLPWCLIRMINEEEVELSEYRDFTDVYHQIDRFIEDTYLHKCIYLALGYLTLVEFKAGRKSS